MARRPFNAQETARAIARELADVVRRDAVGIFTTCTLATPVGDPNLWQNPIAPPGYVGGHARRNWQVSLGGPSGVELAGVDASGLQAIGDGIRTLSTPLLPPIIYIENNVPYANRLNMGWSTQAPANFVERAIAVALTTTDTRVVP